MMEIVAAVYLDRSNVATAFGYSLPGPVARMSRLETGVPVWNVIATAPEKAKALENDVRVRILVTLADREMTVGEIHSELKRRGEVKVETTVRHHANVLEDAGLVEIARLEATSGGTLRY